MRALGIDLGSKRIGIAVSDRSGTIASPLTVLQRTGSPRRDHEAIRTLAEEEEAELLVVGLPLNMNGSSGSQAQAAEKEAQALATVVGVPVIMFDERRTTVTADRALMEANIGARERRKYVDKVAAAVMLQTWLDSRGGRA
ncbi:MAG: Holliday junction resolvase RuvX [Actinomycetota bacterium]|nr:Holliday junction resolvase RuvX [Actinomycetota bacterium]